MNRIAKELMRIARELTAGDEWSDGSTEAFAKLVAREMKTDRHVGKVKASGNVVDFVYSPAVLVFVPLRLTLMEFGYEGSSESVNGTITSTENSAFRVPGGFTRTRDPKELWAKAKDSLVDIFKRAMAGQ